MQLQKETFKKYLDTGEYVLIDVRTSEEQKTYGVISEDQVHIDISKPSATKEILDLDTSKKYLIYCWHGVRSQQVNLFMRENRFRQVYDLEGGIDVWMK